MNLSDTSAGFIEKPLESLDVVHHRSDVIGVRMCQMRDKSCNGRLGFIARQVQMPFDAETALRSRANRACRRKLLQLRGDHGLGLDRAARDNAEIEWRSVLIDRHGVNLIKGTTKRPRYIRQCHLRLCVSRRVQID